MSRELVLRLVVMPCWFSLVISHGRLLDPPGRSTAWRAGYQTPVNYNDVQLFCGGVQHQISLGYKCGLCGDPYDRVRENETGGKYATGTITGTYTEGQRATLVVDLTAYHKGWFEFKICARNSPTLRESQECFDLYPLALADGSGTKYYPGPGSRKIKVEVVLPAGLTCSFCVLQWRYHTGNSWGTDPDGTSGMGRGYQEEFYGCADISIQPSGSGEQPIYTTKPPESINSEHTTNDNLSTVSPELQPMNPQGCRAAGAYVAVPGMDEWCVNNCAQGNCPVTHCKC